MDLELKDKVAVITGGSVGIGLAVAEELASEGVHLALIARGGERAADGLPRFRRSTASRPSASARTSPVPRTSPRALAEIEAAFGGADILISNAGTGTNETVMDAPDEKWQYFWDLHVMAAVRMSRGLIPSMRQRGGGVILMNASICAKQPLGYEPIYNVTKAGLMMFSKCLSNEVIGDNIRVNCINPGLILTPDWVKTATALTAGTDSNAEAYLDDIAKKNAPIGRFGSPEELAHFFVFMCSPLSSYCVGSRTMWTAAG